MKVNPFKLMLGSMFSAEVTTTDQKGRAVTATFEKISEYLQTYDQGAEVLSLTP